MRHWVHLEKKTTCVTWEIFEGLEEKTEGGKLGLLKHDLHLVGLKMPKGTSFSLSYLASDRKTPFVILFLTSVTGYLYFQLLMSISIWRALRFLKRILAL